MKKARGVVSSKEVLSKQVMQIANQCKSLQELAEKLEQQSIESYYRNGRLTGVWLSKRKYRMTTLGIGKEHLKQLTKEQKRLDGLRTFRKKKGKERGLER